MKNSSLSKIVFLISLPFVLFSCGSSEDIVYFQNVDSLGSSKSINSYNSTFKPDDILTIIVSALDYDAVTPFNLPAVQFVRQGGQIDQPTQQSYLVDANGDINFPVLGTIKISGLNRAQATTKLTDLIKEYVVNPIINIRTLNFRVTVLGEVNQPGVFVVNNDRITILEALGLAGDITIQAERKNVLVVREADGKTTYNRVDLTSESVFNSPVYYLTQNDVIYVVPNNSRVKSSTIGPNTTTTLAVLSILVTTSAVVFSILNN